MNILNQKTQLKDIIEPPMICPPVDFDSDELFSYIYCKLISRIDRDGKEYDVKILEKVFTEDELKLVGSTYIDLVKREDGDKFLSFSKNDGAFDYREIITSFSNDLKRNPETYYVLLYYACQKKLHSCFSENDPVNQLKKSEQFYNLAKTFNLKDNEVDLLILMLFDHSKGLLFYLNSPEKIASIFELFLIGDEKRNIHKRIFECINNDLIFKGLFTDPWCINPFLAKFFTRNYLNTNVCCINNLDYPDYYAIEDSIEVNKDEFDITCKIVKSCFNIDKGCFIKINNKDSSRIKSFCARQTEITGIKAYEIRDVDPDFTIKDFIFFITLVSKKISTLKSILIIDMKQIEKYIKNQDDDITFDFSMFNFIQCPVIIVDTNNNQKLTDYISEKIQIVFSWDLKNPVTLNYKNELIKYITSKGRRKPIVESVFDTCEKLMISPEKWKNISMIYDSLFEESKPEELGKIMENLYGNKTNSSRLRKNKFYTFEALRTTEPIDKVITAIKNAQKWENEDYESGIRILNYGMSGTGKTAFVEQLAKTLNRDLKVVRASDILASYVGETEKNIKEIFEKAANDNSILLIDEADSFLQARGDKLNHHNDIAVNEFLIQMERFPGLLFCNTNMPESLDKATDRRFHMKIGFLPLDEKGIGILCKSYFRKYVFTGEQIKRIFKAGDVTPGDFGALFGRIRFYAPEDVTSEYITSELIKIVKGKVREWENHNVIGF